jgi:hypothetical protein
VTVAVVDRLLKRRTWSELQCPLIRREGAEARYGNVFAVLRTSLDLLQDIMEHTIGVVYGAAKLVSKLF